MHIKNVLVTFNGQLSASLRFHYLLSLHLHVLVIPAIPKVAIDPPRPGKLPPSFHNHLPDIDQRRTTTRGPLVTHRRVFTVAPKTTTTATPTTPTTTAPRRKMTTPPRKTPTPTRKPLVPTRKPPGPTRKPYVPPKPVTPTRRTTTTIPPTPPQVTTVDNSIHKDVTKQRGDVHSKFSFVFLFFSPPCSMNKKNMWLLVEILGTFRGSDGFKSYLAHKGHKCDF